MTAVTPDTADCMAKLDEHESSVYLNKADILENKIQILETEVKLARLDKDMASHNIKQCEIQKTNHRISPTGRKIYAFVGMLFVYSISENISYSLMMSSLDILSRLSTVAKC